MATGRKKGKKTGLSPDDLAEQLLASKKAALAKAKRKAKATSERQASAKRFVGALRVRPETFDLGGVDPAATPAFSAGKAEAATLMASTEAELSELQEKLFAQSRHGDPRRLLLVLQGVDASGKAGIVRHVIGLVDPQGVSFRAFKTPTAEERRHPFLWRIRRALPGPGMIGVFDRSHYEDVLVARVDRHVPRSTWRRRYAQIRRFEERLSENGTTLLKIMLHISPQEQQSRFAARINLVNKRWKHDGRDLDERVKWDAYQEAYNEALARTSTSVAPWYVVPADRKWYARLAVQQLLLATLREIDPQWPTIDLDVPRELGRLYGPVDGRDGDESEQSVDGDPVDADDARRDGTDESETQDAPKARRVKDGKGDATP